MKTLNSLLAAAACVMLLAAPAIAQAPMSGDMKGMNMAPKAAKAKKAKPMHAMARAKHTCMDYAWGSQDEKDCEAGKKAAPNWR